MIKSTLTKTFRLRPQLRSVFDDQTSNYNLRKIVVEKRLRTDQEAPLIKVSIRLLRIHRDERQMFYTGRAHPPTCRDE